MTTDTITTSTDREPVMHEDDLWDEVSEAVGGAIIGTRDYYDNMEARPSRAVFCKLVADRYALYMADQLVRDEAIRD